MAVTRTTTKSTTVQHPVYTTWQPVWTKLLHVYDGSGGFLDGTYLVAHPREWQDFDALVPSKPTKKLKARRALARYENVAATILDQKRSALFREPVMRTVGGTTLKERNPHPLELWWEDVDGTGCSIDDWMADAFVWAGLFGHVLHYMDRAQEPADVETAADTNAPFLRWYCPLDVTNWLEDDRGRLRAVKLVEAITPDSIDDQPAQYQWRERVVTDTTWETREYGRARQTLPTTTNGPYPHNFGTLPVVVQYAKRQKLASLIGQPILGDPQLYIDHYNLTSEIRELLRNQTFGILNVTLGTGDNATAIEKAQAMLGTTKGVENVLFSPDAASYIQPDSANVTVYQEERSQLLRTIYRLAAIPWESDSKDAEAEGSLKLKREDMNQVLAAYADQCEEAEYGLAKLWFRSEYGDSWEREWERAQVVIRYPDTFDVTPFEDMLKQVEASTTLPMGATFMAEQCKRMLPKFMPDLPPKLKDTIEQEIDQHAKAQVEMDQQKQEAELKAMQQPPEEFAA